MENALQHRLEIPASRLDEINALLLDPDSRAIQDFLRVVQKHGSPDEINRRAAEARRLPTLMSRLRAMGSPYVEDLEWLIEQRDGGAFISQAEYRRSVLGDRADQMAFAKLLPSRSGSRRIGFYQPAGFAFPGSLTSLKVSNSTL